MPTATCSLGCFFLNICFKFLLIFCKVDNFPNRVDDKHRQKYKYRKFPIYVCKHRYKCRPYNEYYGSNYAFEYSV